MKKFIFKFWARVNDKEEKYLTLRVVPTQWSDEDCPNGYLFIRDNNFAIFVNEEYEIIEERSSLDWKEWFEINLSENLVLQVLGIRCKVSLNLPELEVEGSNLFKVSVSCGYFF